MRSTYAAAIPGTDTTEAYAEARRAEAAGRCAISDGESHPTVTVYWYVAPASSAPGGPAVQVRVRAGRL